MTPARAREVLAAAQAGTGYGPWADRLDMFLTVAERSEVKEEWSRMPGSYSFIDALTTIAQRPDPAPCDAAGRR